MTPYDAIRSLRAVGIDADVVDARTLRADGQVLRIHHTRPSPTRANVEVGLRNYPSTERVLILVDEIRPSLREIAREDRRVVVVSADEVLWDLQAIPVDDSGAAREVTKAPGRPPYVRYAIGRALLASHAPMTQQELVSATKASQPQVSKALRTSLFHGVINPEWGGIRVENSGRLFDRIVHEYPGPGGVTTYWWHDLSLAEQANSVTSVDTTALISGDLAADRISAWRTPEHAVVYTQAAPDLRALGFAMATRTDHTLALIHAEDRTIWATAQVWGRPGIVDPLMATIDVERTATLGDQGEAMARIRDYVVRR